MNRYIVDHIEDNGVAVLEADDLSLVDVPLSELPAGTKRGDCLELDDGAWRIDADRTARRRERLEAKRRALFRRPE